MGRARVRTGYTWSGSAWAVFLKGMSGTRGSGSLPRQVGRAVRVLTEHSTSHDDGMSVIQKHARCHICTFYSCSRLRSERDRLMKGIERLLTRNAPNHGIEK